MTTYTYGVVPATFLNPTTDAGFRAPSSAVPIPQPPISEVVGFHLTEADTGRAVFEGLPEARHYNPIGTVHGGFAATLLDSALGCAIFSTLAKGDGWTTLELKFNLVRPLTKDTGMVRAEGRIVHRGRTRGDGGRQPEGPRRQTLRARHDDVHDLSGEELKPSCCSRSAKAAVAAAGYCSSCGSA